MNISNRNLNLIGVAYLILFILILGIAKVMFIWGGSIVFSIGFFGVWMDLKSRVKK